MGFQPELQLMIWNICLRNMEKLETFTFQKKDIVKTIEDLLSSDFMTEEMQKMLWMHWMEKSLKGET